MDFNNDIVDYEGSDYRITEAIGLSESAFQSNNPRITDGFRGMVSYNLILKAAMKY